MNNNNFSAIKNSVEKALFDYTISSNKSNPTFLTNKDKGIQSQIQESLKKCHSYDIAVSYVVLSGLQRLLEDLDNKKNSRFLTTIDGFVTEPNALEKLYELKCVKTKVFVPKHKGVGFHAKTYLFKTDKSCELIIGSANISNRAFGDVHESSMMVEVSEGGELFRRYQENFEHVWNDSIDLTPEFINDYREKFNIYKNKQNPEFYNKKHEITPNSMQKDALMELKKVRDQGSKRALIVASTGSGKTYLSAFDTMQFNPGKMLFIVHNRTILRKAMQTFKTIFKEKFNALELKSSNIKIVNDYNFIFTTNHTLSKHVSKFNRHHFDYIVIDEAHHTPASTYLKIIDYFEPKFLLGMTATPDRPDANIKAKDVYEKYDHVIPYEIRLHDAIENNLIAPFNYFGIGEDLADERVQISDKVETILRNIKKYGHFGVKLKALAFVDTIKSAEDLAQEFVGYNIGAVAVSGKTDPDLVDQYLNDLGDDNSPLQIIVSVNKLNEGIDVPEINTIIMLRKTDSAIIYIQQLGRGLRLSDPGKFVTVLDFVGNYAGSYAIIQGIMDVPNATQYELKETLLAPKAMLSNIQLDEISRKRIYESIDRNMKSTKTILKNQFIDWVDKWGYIPTMNEYANKINKMDEILLHFDSYQAMKEHARKTILNDNELSFFRIISQGVLQSGTEEQIHETFNILINKEGVISDDFLRSYLLGDLKTHGVKEQAYFVNDGNKIRLNILNMFENKVFKKEFDEFVDYIQHNIRNNYLLLHKNYRRLDIPFMAKRSSLKSLMEGQFYKNNKYWCMPKLARQDSDAVREFENRIIDSKHIHYITKSDNHTKEIISGKHKPEFFIAHADSKDSYLTYIGPGSVKAVLAEPVQGKPLSKMVIFELDHELPEWMVKDYQY